MKPLRTVQKLLPSLSSFFQDYLAKEEAIKSIHPSAVLPNSLSSHHSTKSVFPEVKPSLSVYEQLASPAPIGIHPLPWTLQGWVYFSSQHSV